jgi:hypothetical protein
MRPTLLLPLLALAAAAPAAAQAIVIPIRCSGPCPRTLAIDTAKVWTNVNVQGRAVTYVDHVFRNTTSAPIEAAFFFPIPAGAEVERAWVQDGPQHKLESYNEWTRPEESRLILDGLARQRPGAGLGAYARWRVVHVRVPPIPPGGVKQVQIGYAQTLQPRGGGEIAFRYPLALAASASPIGHLTLGMEIKTRSGFSDLRSPSHPVQITLGMESGPCGPQERCGTRGYPSQRVKVVRLEPGANVRRRDFELTYVLAPPGTVRPLMDEDP